MEKRKCTVCGKIVTARQFSLPPEKTRCNHCIGRAIANSRSPESWDPIRKNPNLRNHMTDSSGYVYVRMPEHQNANSMGYVKRANLVWEEANGKRVSKGYILHHIDGDKQNDDISNLKLMTPSKHVTLHTTQRWRENRRKKRLAVESEEKN